ncbi:TonB C-terminal domain-containing protein [Arcobacter sp. FWKO B]|uniref:TonB C-terminal domain-containing protein n=1 Tax=Arcobacter sp. FWKO B TaxID=2593672 RepID=UPI0018A52EDF|nr:TonB C-terminal domain-containing protein [Arcobacter sp. FWKO B]QOG11757.1 TonB C-terminal domain-containing protein [Arcobacter sp. FWKO B]
MPTTNNQFLISGIISFSIYFILIFAILFYMVDPDIKRVTAFNKNTAIELDISLIEEKAQPKAKFEKPIEKKEEIPIEEKSASKATVTTTDMKSLFANVTTQTQNVIKQDVVQKESVKVASVFKSSFEKESRSEISTNVSKRLDNVNINPTSSLSPPSDAVIDEYYSLIYEILASKWQPSIIKENLSSDVIITIYKNGKFAYNIISKSGDSNFDVSLERFLNNQLNVKFPEHNKGEKTSLKVTFKTKGE